MRPGLHPAPELGSRAQVVSLKRPIDFHYLLRPLTVGLGVAPGNIVVGVPPGADKEYAGTFLAPPNPYVLLTMLAVADIPREISRGREMRACLSSCATVAGLMALIGIGLYPDLVRSAGDPALSLDIHNAASSTRTLKTMLVIAIVGVPFVVACTVSIYWIFRGKVKLDGMSY